MIEQLAKNLVILKKQFVKIYDGNSQIQEVIPISKSSLFPIEAQHLNLLHQFAKQNPIYYNSFEKMIGETLCIVYEGDINRYWLHSIEHESSHAPFSPTWIMSAYVCSLAAKNLGSTEAIDIGSGDGRIAFCSSICNMKSYSIEIDEQLIDLQKKMSKIIDFNSYCSDAKIFDYQSLNLKRPIFFIGGLAQMGGDKLASAVLEKIHTTHDLQKSTLAFTGTISKKYPPDSKNEAGWGTLMEKYGLVPTQRIFLPTAWTFNELDDALYIFARQ